MLAQLNQPYYYSYYCIYRDFAAARWKYFVKQNTVHQLPNPEAKQELLDTEDSGEIYSVPCLFYHEDKIYEVVSSESINPDYYLIPEEIIHNMKVSKKKAKVLKPGDRVGFVHNTPS